jgi:hypothetical protein
MNEQLPSNTHCHSPFCFIREEVKEILRDLQFIEFSKDEILNASIHQILDRLKKVEKSLEEQSLEGQIYEFDTAG